MSWVFLLYVCWTASNHHLIENTMLWVRFPLKILPISLFLENHKKMITRKCFGFIKSRPTGNFPLQQDGKPKKWVIMFAKFYLLFCNALVNFEYAWINMRVNSWLERCVCLVNSLHRYFNHVLDSPRAPLALTGLLERLTDRSGLVGSVLQFQVYLQSIQPHLRSDLPWLLTSYS